MWKVSLRVTIWIKHKITMGSSTWIPTTTTRSFLPTQPSETSTQPEISMVFTRRSSNRMRSKIFTKVRVLLALAQIMQSRSSYWTMWEPLLLRTLRPNKISKNCNRRSTARKEKGIQLPSLTTITILTRKMMRSNSTRGKLLRLSATIVLRIPGKLMVSKLVSKHTISLPQHLKSLMKCSKISKTIRKKVIKLKWIQKRHQANIIIISLVLRIQIQQLAWIQLGQ